MESIKYDVPSVSKSVARCHKYVYSKVSLAKGYKPGAWGQVKMLFISVPGKVIYTQAKAYWPIILLFLMQKTMQ
jgi:hypothetical protein